MQYVGCAKLLTLVHVRYSCIVTDYMHLADQYRAVQ